MRKICILFIALSSCTSAPQAPKEKTYRECIAEQDKIREQRFSEMPEKLKTFAGRHSVVKYFEKRPKYLADIVSSLKKESATFNARDGKGAASNLELRLLDTSPGRNRVLIGFEKKSDSLWSKSEQDKLVLKLDYSKPVVGYFFPLNSLKEKSNKPGVFEGRYKSEITAKTPSSYKGKKISRSIDFTIYIEPVGRDHLYVEWINHSFTGEDEEDWKNFMALLYTADADRFLDWEHPYFDPAGELSPETCSALEGE